MSFSSAAKRSGGRRWASAVEIADVGEQHRQLAPLAAEPQQRRIATHEIDQVRAQIVLERGPDGTLLPLADEVAVGQHDEIDEGQRRERQEQVEPQAEVHERQDVGRGEARCNQKERRGSAQHAAALGDPADQDPRHDHGHEVDQHARLAAHQKIPAQDAVDHGGVALDPGHQARERRHESIADAGRRAADQHDLAREQGGARLAIEHGGRGHRRKAARPVVVDRQAHALVGRHQAILEHDALAQQQPGAVATDAQMFARDLEREGGIVVGPVADHGIFEPLRTAAIERRVDVAEPCCGAAELGDRCQHAPACRRLGEIG